MLKAFNKLIDRLEDFAMVAFISTATVVICFQVIIRYFFNDSVYWAEELAIYSIIAMTFIGASMGVRYGSHISVDVLNAIAPPIINKILHIVAAIIGIIFSIYIIYYGTFLFHTTWNRGQLSPAMRLPMAIFYLPIIVSGVLMCIRYMQLTYTMYKQPPRKHSEELVASADTLV